MRETRVEVARGLSLTLASWGTPGDRPPVLVLHGFLEQAAAWHDVAERLVAEGRQVVAPDHRGHAASDWAPAGTTYHFWDYVGDVDAIVASLGEPVDLVGHSMGGTMATLFAATRPEAVRRLVLVEGLGPPDLTGTATARAVQYLDARRTPLRHPRLASVEAAAARMRRHNPRLAEATALRLSARVVRPVRDDDVLQDGTDGDLTWSWDPKHRGRTPVPFQAALHQRFLDAIGCPVLAVDGAVTAFSLPDADARLACLSDVRHEVVADAGHLVHLDQPDALAHLLLDFLEPS